MGQAIMITSGKGGSGKSTLTKAMGQFLSDAGKKVVLVDMDMGMRSLDLMMGIENKVVYDLSDVADGTCKIRQALIRAIPDREFYVLNAAQTRGSEALTPGRVEQIMRTLKEHFDFILIDCPAGVGRGFRNAAAGADKAIIVCLPDHVSVRDAERVVGLLERSDIKDPLLVVNRMPMDAPPPGGLALSGIEQTLHLTLLGWIPDEGGFLQQRLNHSEAGRAMERITKRLLGEPLDVAKYKARGFFGRLGRAVKPR